MSGMPAAWGESAPPELDLQCPLLRLQNLEIHFLYLLQSEIDHFHLHLHRSGDLSEFIKTYS